MKCSNPECKADLQESWKVCPFCLTEVSAQKKCTACGHILVNLPPDANFCPECGEKYDTGSIFCFCNLCEYKDECGKKIKTSGASNYTENIISINLDMVFVEGGTFMMGATFEQGDDARDNEKPVHQVTVSGFYIGKYPVTQTQWKAFMGNNPSHFNGDSLPVENVSWNDAQEFIHKLNAQTGKQYRLPTEAEWEFAARGGVRGCKYSGSNNINEVAWFDENSGNKTHPVGNKQANELGIFDMSGNVWEWCNDWYGNYDSNAQTNPKGAPSGSNRVLRGGSWYNYAQRCRVSYRNHPPQNLHSPYYGFRLALVP